MPTKPPKPCKVPGCKSITRRPSGFCDNHLQHEKRMRSEFDRHRLSSTMRGYGYKWQKYREAYLHAHPLCEECKRRDRIEAATVVDHIQDHEGDMRLFWDVDNHQALCKSCHDRKTARTVGFGRRRALCRPNRGF